ncbi:MAG: hypothetical protein KGJ06_07590 [Pseudomonadota bacterium]|nr:hypothetical protein [Pseudomonadota bacterium]
MADPIKHDIPSTVLTGLWEGAKGALFGAALLTLAGIALGAVGAFFIPIVSVGTGAVLGAAGGLATSAVAYPVTGGLAGIGALIGLARGGSRISAENSAYQAAMDKATGARQNAMEKQVNDRVISEMPQVYDMAFQQGAMQAQAKMQEALPQALQAAYQKGSEEAKAQMVQEAHKPETHAHHKHDKPVFGPHSASVVQQQAAAAKPKELGA